MSQRRVNLMRRRCGIPVISKADRFNLPPLNPKQLSVLLGSLLGDACLFSTGFSTAALSEFHSASQKDYLLWKADIWGSFVCSIREGRTHRNGKTYTGSILRTHASWELYPYWKASYPNRIGDKVFYGLDLTGFDALSLAVWYLDDGGKTSNGYVRFAVTPDAQSQQVQLDLLKGFGLKPRLHPHDGDFAIWLHDRDSLARFLDLVGEHIPASMSYKLNLVPRSRGTSPRVTLTEESLRSFAEKQRSVDWISQATATSATSVRRALNLYGLSVGQGQKTSWSDVEQRIQMGVSKADLVDLLVSLDMPDPPSLEVAQRDFQNLRQKTLATIDDTSIISGGGRVGSSICELAFPYRYEATKSDCPSLKRAWFDPTWVTKAVDFQVKQGDPLLPRNIFRALKALIRTPSNFRPPVAKKLVETFSPEGGLVLDPCAGYGGRAVGTLAAGRSYIGVDPHPKAKDAYKSLFGILGVSPEALVFHNSPFEDINLDVQADLVLTSPPYFSAERYSDDPKQSWVRFPTWDLWVSKFLRTLIFKSFNNLKSEGRMLLNVCDPVISGRRVPLVQACLDLALEAGFLYDGSLQMTLGYLGSNPKFEPILVFSKTFGTCQVPVVLIPRGQVPKTYATRTALTEEKLRRHYQEELLTDSEIAKIYKVSDVLVSQQRKYYGVPTISPRRRSELKRVGPSLDDLTKEMLTRLRETMSFKAIGALYGVSKIPIVSRCRKWGIQ
jgi:hypothetical protein